jgi:hypothetical protein
MTGRAYSAATLPELDLWNWPLVHGGWRSWLIVAGTLAVGAAAGWVSASPLMGLLSTVAVMLSMWRFWLPVRYYIRGRGIVEEYLGRRHLIAWRSIKHCRLRKQGVVILFDDKQLLMDAFGAKYIEGRDQQEQLAAVINFYRQSDSNDTLDPADSLRRARLGRGAAEGSGRADERNGQRESEN